MPNKPKQKVQDLKTHITNLKENNKTSCIILSFNREHYKGLTKHMMNDLEKEIEDAWLPKRYAEKQQITKKITETNKTKSDAAAPPPTCQAPAAWPALPILAGPSPSPPPMPPGAR